MRRFFSWLVVLVVWTTAAHGSEFQSSFGFTANVPADWVVLTKQALADTPTLVDMRPETVGNVNPELLRNLKAKVESGSMEMLFDRTTSDATFANNINVMVRRGRIPDALDQVRQVCEAYPAKLAKFAGRNLNVVRCERRALSKSEAFYIEYEGVVTGTVSMQYQIPRPNNELLLITATCKQASVEKIRPEFEEIVRSIRFS
ncbi:MAG: hypothetical protein A2Y78_09770 [Acidobacteria bacterium RBG_13_68_16]|nr:MAG: hypothetical protein A2Y78_09770 [Acidobacteria bacterium RBG_13_68_16]